MNDPRGVPIPADQPYSAARERGERSDGIGFILAYIRRRNYRMAIGTGNAFGAQARDPAAFARKLQQGRFYCWDYISAGEILEADRVTPNAVLARVKQAMRDALPILLANAARGPWRGPT
jgi:hypothetical protein